MAGGFNQGLILVPTLSYLFQFMLFQGVCTSGQFRYGAATKVGFIDGRTVSLAAKVIPLGSALVPSHEVLNPLSPQISCHAAVIVFVW